MVASADSSRIDPLKLREPSSSAAAGVAPASCGILPVGMLSRSRPGLIRGCRGEQRGRICSHSPHALQLVPQAKLSLHGRHASRWRWEERSGCVLGAHVKTELRSGWLRRAIRSGGFFTRYTLQSFTSCMSVNVEPVKEIHNPDCRYAVYKMSKCAHVEWNICQIKLFIIMLSHNLSDFYSLNFTPSGCCYKRGNASRLLLSSASVLHVETDGLLW